MPKGSTRALSSCECGHAGSDEMHLWGLMCAASVSTSTRVTGAAAGWSPERKRGSASSAALLSY